MYTPEQAGWSGYRLLISVPATMWCCLRSTVNPQDSRSDRLGRRGTGVVAALHWVKFWFDQICQCLCPGVFLPSGFSRPCWNRSSSGRIKWLEVLLGPHGDGRYLLFFILISRYKTGILMGMASAVFLTNCHHRDPAICAADQPETVLTYQLTGGSVGLTLILLFTCTGSLLTKMVAGPKTWPAILVLSWLCSYWLSSCRWLR